MIGEIKIITNPYLPGPTQIKHAGKGPYQRRREKKLAADPKNWKAPDIYLVDGAVMCHPSQYDLLVGLLCGGEAKRIGDTGMSIMLPVRSNHDC